MNLIVYNLSILVGVLLVGVGVGLWSIPGGLVAGGILVIGLTVYGAEKATRKR